MTEKPESGPVSLLQALSPFPLTKGRTKKQRPTSNMRKTFMANGQKMQGKKGILSRANQVTATGST
jgi:hypothetical protein